MRKVGILPTIASKTCRFAMIGYTHCTSHRGKHGRQNAPLLRYRRNRSCKGCLRVAPGRGSDTRPGGGQAASISSGTSRLQPSYCRPQTMAAMPRRAACGLAPLASHRAMNWGGTSTSRTFEAGTL